MYILIPSGYILWVTDLIASLQGPAVCLQQGIQATAHIEPSHTKALAADVAGSSLLTATWQHPCLHAWVQALATCWGIQLLLVSFTQLAAIMISSCSPAAPAPTRNAGHVVNACGKDLGFKTGSQWWAAKYSSNPAKFRDSIRDRENKELIQPKVEQCRWSLRLGRQPWAVIGMLRMWLQIIQAILPSLKINHCQCSETGQLSSLGLFLSKAAVHCHMAASKSYSAAKWASWKSKLMSWPVTSWPGGGTVGPEQDMQHQPEITASRN
jgi:hypothetical protein